MQKFKLSVFIGFFWICFQNLLPAQNSIGITYSPAKFVQHSKKATFDSPSYSYLIDLRCSLLEQKLVAWKQYWNNPKIQLHAAYIDYGDAHILGKAFGVFPSIGFSVVRLKNYQLRFQIGSGIAYVTKVYDKIDNPKNSAIGAHLNNITQIAFANTIRVSNELDAIFDLHLTHVSNSATSTPNAGLNLVGASIGIYKKFQNQIPKTNIALSDSAFTVSHRWFLDAHYGYGISEYSFAGGPKFKVDVANLGVGYHISRYFHLMIGGEYEFKRSTFQFFYQDFETEAVARILATRWSAYGSGQMDFGPISIRGQVGTYIFKDALIQNTFPYYVKLTTIVSPFPKNWQLQPYLGVQLKSHGAVAQYLALVSGIRWR